MFSWLGHLAPALRLAAAARLPGRHSLGWRTGGWLALMVSVALSGLGCSRNPRTYPAGGRVVFEDGEPLRGGRIELKSADHPLSARGRIDRKGQFTLTTFKPLDGAIAGAHQVIVLPESVLNLDNPEQHLSHVRPVDQKLGRFATTWLGVQIDPNGDNRDLLIEIK